MRKYYKTYNVKLVVYYSAASHDLVRVLFGGVWLLLAHLSDIGDDQY